MKAAILETLGTNPSYGDFREPVAEGNETIVEVSAAAIKQLERLIASGTHYSSPKTLPIICGVDGVGRDGAGRRVYFMVKRRPFGAMAERAPAAWTVPVPEGIDDAHAAAVVNPGLAAWLPLRYRGKLEPGETVVILGATGTTGRMAVTAARLLKAGRVVACGRRKEVLAGLGADAIIDLSQSRQEVTEAFAREAEAGIGVVVDYIWGWPAEALISVLTHTDLGSDETDRAIRYVSVGAMAGPTIALPSGTLRGSRLELLGSGTGNLPAPPILGTVVAEILSHAAAGRLPLQIARYPLADVDAAWADTADPDRRPILTIGG